MADYKAIILAGGKGTRMGDFSPLPKALTHLRNGSLIGLIITALRKQNIKDIYVSVGYKKEMIMNYLKDSVHYIQEDKLLGTGGWMSLIDIKDFTKPFFVINGDDLFDIDLNEMVEHHEKYKSQITIALTKQEDTSEYGRVRMEGDRIISFVEKGRDKGPGWISSGYYLMDPSVIDLFRGKVPLSLEKEVFPKIMEAEKLYGVRMEGRWHDVGTPERIKEAYDWEVRK